MQKDMFEPKQYYYDLISDLADHGRGSWLGNI